MRKPTVHLKRLIDHFLLEKEVQPASSRCSFYRTLEEQATDKEAQTVHFGDFGEIAVYSRRNLFEPARF